MLSHALEAILKGLTATSAFKTVDAWQGDVDELLKQVQKLPSAHAIMSGAEFDAPSTIGATVAPSETVWSVIIMFQNLRSRSAGTVDGYDLIETVLTTLTRLNTGAGYLWPRRVQLIAAERGKIAYGFHFAAEKGR